MRDVYARAAKNRTPKSLPPEIEHGDNVGLPRVHGSGAARIPESIMSKFRLLKTVKPDTVGVVDILTERVNDPNFRVDGLMVKVVLTISNSASTSATLASEGLMQSSTVKVLLADSKPMFNGVSWRALEWLSQAMGRGYVDALVEQADRSIAAISNGTEDQTFWLWLPLADPSAKNPIDFSMALSLIESVSLNIGSTGVTSLAVEKVQASLIAYGEETEHGFVGARVLVEEKPNLAGIDAVDLSLAGRRLSHLLVYSKKNSSSPIAMTSPAVEIDNAEVMSYLNMSATDIQAALGARGFGSFPARSTLTQTSISPLVMPSEDYEISKLREGRQITVKSATNAHTAGEQAFIVRSVAPNDALKAYLPGGNQRDNEQVVQIPGGVLQSDIRRFLPAKIYPRAAGAGCGSCEASCNCGDK